MAVSRFWPVRMQQVFMLDSIGSMHRKIGQLESSLSCAECKLPEVQEPSGEDYLDAASAILPYLIGHRSRLQAFEAPGSPDKKELQPGSASSTEDIQSAAEDEDHESSQVCHALGQS